MWRKVVYTVVVPLLFALVTALLSLFIVDMVRYSQKHISLPRSEPEWIFSQYDKMFQEVGEEYSVDWLLLSAIAYAESKYDADAVSKVGAMGLMQVMPAVARNMGHAPEALSDARSCTEIAARLLHDNNKMLHFPQNFDATERIKFILACYNAGYSRIADARSLTRYHDADADKWSEVALYLPLLAEAEYAEHEAVQSGPFYGSAETIAYVAKVMRVYGRYKRKMEGV